MSLVVSLLLQGDYEQAKTLFSVDPSCIKVALDLPSQPGRTLMDNARQVSPRRSETGLDSSAININDVEDPTIFYALGDVETLELLLLTAPQSAWAQNHKGDRPLHAACQLRNVHKDIISILLFAFPEGASAKNRDGKLAFHFAVANIHDICIIRMVYDGFPNAVAEKESKNNSKPLHYACAFKAPLPVIQLLVEKHIQAVEQRNRQGNLPLHLTLMYDAPEEVKQYLIESYEGAVQERDSKGRLPLHIAAQCSTITVVTIEKLLSIYPQAINATVMLNENNSNTDDQQSVTNWLIGKKCVHISIRFLSGRADIIQCLLSNAAYKEVLKKDSRSSISHAVRKKAIHQEANKETKISEEGPKQESENLTFYLNGDTLLHTAIEFNASIEVLETITSLRPSSLKEENNDGKLPIHFAAWRQVGPATMVFLIRNYPESLMIVDEKTGNVALHYALQYSPTKVNADANTEMIEKVLSHMPAACFVINKAGYYPIHLATRARCPYHIIEAMLKVVPYSFGFFSENRLRLLPIDFAIASNASADVIGLLLGYVGKGDIINPKRIMDDRQNPNPYIDGSAIPQQTSPLPLNDGNNHITEGTRKDSTPLINEHDGYPDICTLMDAHLDLQQKFTIQGEEMRKLRARNHSIAGDLHSRNEEIKGIQKDVSWGKDRVKILEREIKALTTELASFKGKGLRDKTAH